ncbi:glycosyltransferase family 2 protein [Halonotius roseus]|uniref:glycosyltransferase family 2 protein n=1 Tax=Halonotius roseus TaxID=2511997 RepID=UPI00163C0210|nr:glycosyltransferase family 2 protein [Halonotius roseus]
METNIAQLRSTNLEVTKSVTKISEDDQLVRLSVRSAASNPVKLSLTDNVSSEHTLHVGDPDSGSGYTDGAITIESVVDPEKPTAFEYHLTGSTEGELPEPTIDSVSPAATNGDTPTRVEWIGPEGKPIPIAVTARTETVLLLTSSETSPTPATRRLQGVGIGIVLTAANEDAACRTVLRARKRGHPVFVISRLQDEDVLEAVADLGATLISPLSRRASQNDLHRALSQAAREHGATGIILQTRDCPRIDYDRTAAAFEQADYDIIAIPEYWEQATDSPRVVVGIPAYNAADSIGTVVDRAAAYADEVIVVDDGSGDETANRAQAAGATVVVHERNRGYGGALKTLFREAAGREAAHLVVIDADGQHDPADIPTLVETQTRNDVDVVIGSRYVGKRKTKIPFVRSVGLAVINGLTNASLGKLRPSGFIHDTQSGYRCYSLYATRSLAGDRLIGDNMGASTDILYHAHRNRLSVSEVETTISYDVENASSQGSVSHGLDLLRNIFWAVEYGRPLLILGVPGGLITLFGVMLTVLLIGQSAATGIVDPVRLVPSILFAVVGLLLCIAAVMMQVLNRHPSMKRLNDDENS